MIEPTAPDDQLVSQFKEHVVERYGDWSAWLVSDLVHNLRRLRRFKDYVHGRLDDAGIPTHPGGPNSAAGCRIGDRLDVLLSRIEALEKDNITTRARLTLRANDLVQMREALICIRDALDDEGDRVYFGSTNHADQLREAVEMLDTWAWGDIIGDTDAPDYIGDLRATRLQLEALEKAAAPFLPCVPIIRPREKAQAMWLKALASLPDDKVIVWAEGDAYEWRVTMGDIRALARAAGGGE